MVWWLRSVLSRRRREEPLRKEIRARAKTFWTNVDVKDQRGPGNLTVAGDLFEVSQDPLAQFLLGKDSCYRAQDTTVELVRGSLHDWIEIAGQPGTGLSPVQVRRRKMNRQIWDALVRAGAQPIGPPPQP